MAAGPDRFRRMSRSGLSCPAAYKLRPAGSGPRAHSREAHSGCRPLGRGASMSIHAYQHRRSAVPKVQRLDVSLVAHPVRGTSRMVQ
jgi:hypothetical protein